MIVFMNEFGEANMGLKLNDDFLWGGGIAAHQAEGA